MAIYYVDGKYVEDSQAALPLSDLAVLRGYAVFDFLRTYNGSPFHLEEHVLRLQKSASLLHLSCPWSVREITEIVNELLERNKFWETNLRFVITGGDSLDSITPSNKPRLLVMATELNPFPKEWYAEGVKIVSAKVTRYLPGAKSTNYIKAIMALRNARKTGAIESIYVNETGHLLEGTTSNLFAVIDGAVVTPSIDILPGITRKVVLELIEGTIPSEHRALKIEDLDYCSELFITSSNKEVVPVVMIDDRTISEGPGPLTQKIMTLFRQYTREWK